MPSSDTPPNGNPADTLQSLSDALATSVLAVSPSIVAIHGRRRIPASGIIWRPGYVMASDHTVRRDEGITVSLSDGKRVDAVLIGRDPGTDLALLKLAEGATPSIAPLIRRDATAPALRVGELVLAVGRPGDGITATLGTIHAIGGEWRTWQGGQLTELLRVDIAIHDGFSGSALIDAEGRIIGINSSVLARGAPAVVPAATVDRVFEQLKSGGRVARGWLGVGTQPIRLADKIRADASISQDVGLLIVGIANESPAERAGLHVGDTLVSLAGTPTREANDVLTILGPETVNRTLTARIVRAGELVEIPVTIGESPHRNTRHGGHHEEGHREHERDSDHYHEHQHGRFHAFGPTFVYGFSRCGPRRGR